MESTQISEHLQTVSVSLDEAARYLNSDSQDKDIITFESATVLRDVPPYPIRFESLVIILCTDGAASIGIDLEEYEVKRNSLLVITPRNYMYFREQTASLRCKVIMCSKNVIEATLPKHSELFPVILNHSLTVVTQLSDAEAQSIEQFYDMISLKLAGPTTEFRKSKTLCLIKALVYEMMDIRLTHSNSRNQPASRKEEIMTKFILLICENFHRHRQVSFYAEQLFITPKHLSAVAKETSGRSASEWIESYVIMEAKVLLKSTDLTIQEIAAKLNFANQSFFGKYFKHITGYSPTRFRNLKE